MSDPPAVHLSDKDILALKYAAHRQRGIVGIYSDPRHIIENSDGEVRQQFNVCFSARLLGGTLRASDESTEVAWITHESLENLPIHDTTRLRLRHFLERRASPCVG